MSHLRVFRAPPSPLPARASAALMNLFVSLAFFRQRLPVYFKPRDPITHEAPPNMLADNMILIVTLPLLPVADT